VSAVANNDDENANAPYEVGYGRPPVSTRFKEGQSGNPKGRPKQNPKPIGELLLDVFDKPVTVTFGRHEQTVDAAKALLMNLIHRAIKGEAKSLRKLGNLLEKSRLLGRTEDPDHPTGVVSMNEEELAELRAYPGRWLDIVRRARTRAAAKAPPIETARLSGS
jgi:hypothetical protein